MVSSRPTGRLLYYVKTIIMKSKGLGDTIEKFTQTTGIKTLAQFTTRFTGKKDCGCNKRKEALNKKFPYKK